MPESPRSRAEEFGKKGVRFTVTLIGLLLLRGLLSVLPMLKNATAIGNTFLSPIVLSDAIVDTLILASLLTFGFTVSRILRESYPRVADLSTATLFGIVLLILVLAYNLFELPIACVVVSPQDAFTADAANAARAALVGAQLSVGDMFNQIANGMSAQLTQALRNVSGDTLAAYQRLAVFKLRQSPDIYGWTFLLLSAIPVVGIVILGSRNLDRISELFLHKAREATTGVQQDTAPATEAEARCNSCGQKMAVDAKFCPQCGAASRGTMPAAAARKCPSCGTENSSTAKFCKECGRAV